MSDVRITPRYRTEWRRNKRTGEDCSFDVPLKGYWVNGGFFAETSHMTLAGAEKEKALRTGMNERFPFVPPRTRRELDKARRLGLAD